MSMSKLKLASNIVSVGLLALCLTLASWFLLSYPVSIPVYNYFSSVNNSAGDINSTENAFNVSLDVQKSVENKKIDAEKKVRDDGLQQDRERDDHDSKIDQPLSENTSKKNTTESTSKSSFGVADQKARDDELQQDNKRVEDDGKIDQPLSESTSKNNTAESSSKSSLEVNTLPSDIPVNSSSGPWQNISPSDKNSTENAFNVTLNVQKSVENRKSVADQKVKDDTSKNNTECDLYHGEWYYDQSGTLYTNKSCPIITDKQNCQANGRPDKGFESWRWKPSQCVLPKFDANKFLELMRGKTLAFFGDSVSHNQMTSLVCILWQVEVPESRRFDHLDRWYFKSRSVSIVRIWSAWLVNQTKSAFKDIPEGIPKVFLDIPHETLMKHAPKFDVIVVSSGHWFTTKSVYVSKNKVVGGQLWAPPNGHKLPVNNVEAFRIALDTSITALAMHSNYTGLTILRSYSPDHYGGGAWNTGGSCTGKVEPAHPNQLMKNKFTDIMYKKQVTGYNRTAKKRTNKSKMRLMDITKAFSYRHDGHPGPYWTGDPIKRTKPGPDGRLHPQDCVHWCLPGPIDTWNEFLLEIIRREFEK